MTAYVLTHDGLFRNLSITTHADSVDAENWLAASKKVGGEAVVGPEDLKYAGASLVILYNYLADIKTGVSHVTKFETKTAGQRRCFSLIEDLFQNQAPEAAALPTANTEAAAAPSEGSSETTETSTNEDTMATKGKKTAKKAKTAKTPKAPRVKKEAKPKAGVDDFGLRKGSKNSAAAAMFARASGATMAKVKEAVGDTFYGMLGKLEDAGHKVKKDGKTIFLIAK